MTDTNRWRKSTYSSSNGGNCTEVAAAPGAILVRDSKNPDGPRLTFGPDTWRAFADRVKAGA
ncbi:MAG: DUF397 domain-containing protein [Streptosporangiaceae bacterium]